MECKLNVSTVQGRIITLDIASMGTVYDLKAMLLQMHPRVDPIERKILKADVLCNGSMIHDDQTLAEAGLLDPESEVSVVYKRNEVEAATRVESEKATDGFCHVNIPRIRRIDDCAFHSSHSLVSVTIPDAVTEIGGSAFAGCWYLEKIALPDSVTRIGGGSFQGCSSLESIVIPNSVIDIGQRAFDGCSSLKNITIPGVVTKIHEMSFADCSSLENIDIPGSVQDIGKSAFQGCSSLKNIIIPDSVTHLREMAFAGCSSLENIVIPDSVTFVGERVFEGCSSLSHVPALRAASWKKSHPWFRVTHRWLGQCVFP